MHTHETSSSYTLQSVLAIQYPQLKELTELCDLYATEHITSYIKPTNRALEKTDHVEFQRTF